MSKTRQQQGGWELMWRLIRVLCPGRARAPGSQEAWRALWTPVQAWVNLVLKHATPARLEVCLGSTLGPFWVPHLIPVC